MFASGFLFNLTVYSPVEASCTDKLERLVVMLTEGSAAETSMVTVASKAS